MTPDASDLCVFAIRRGKLENRIDPHFCLPKFQAIIEHVKARDYTQLGKVVAFSKETTDFREFADEKFDYLEISGVAIGTNTYKTVVTAVADAPSRAKMKTQKGDIVISTTRPHRGAIAEICDNNIIASTGFSIIREVDSTINKNWLLYVLMSDICLQQMLQRSSGGNYPAIIEDEIKNIYIPIVSYSKQIALVEVLQEKLQERNQRLQKSTSILESMSEHIHSTLGIKEICYRDSIVSAARMVDLQSDNTFSAEYYHPERIAAIQAIKSSGMIRKLSDVVDFQRDIVASSGSSNYMGLAGVESQTGELSGVKEDAAGQAFTYCCGDVLYGRLRPYLNKVLFAEEDGICSTEFHVMRVKDKTVVLPEYLAAILRSDMILSQTKHMMTGNTHPRISNDDVKNLCIPVPDISLQQTIVNELEIRRHQARALKKQAELEWQAARQQFEKALLGD